MSNRTHDERPRRLIASLSARYPGISCDETYIVHYDDGGRIQCLNFTGTSDQLKQAGLINDELILAVDWVNGDGRRKGLTTEFGDRIHLWTRSDDRVDFHIFSHTDECPKTERSVSSQRMATEFRRIWKRITRAPA